MSIMRIRFQIAGPGGLPGVHTTYWNGASSTPTTADATDCAGRVRAFWDSFKVNVSGTVTVSCNQPADVLNPATGALENQLSVGAPANVVCTGSGELPKATMMLLRYNTGVVLNRRLIRGRSFIGPLGTGNNTNGTVVPASQTALLTAAAFLNTGATASKLVVWHRPTELLPASGVVAEVISYATNTEFSVLRSRRD